MNICDYKVIIVGSGFYGSTMAHQIVTDLEIPVLIVEARNHVGGNSYSYKDQNTNIEIHKYGPHIFHTSNTEVWNFINKFTSFNDYIHRVWSNHNGQLYSFPINQHSLSQFYGKAISPEEIKDILPKETLASYESFEDKALALIGKNLYEAFYKHYTIKQWGKDPKEIPASVFSRLPIRFNLNSRYFLDKYQGIPSNGYSEIFYNMLKNKLIDVLLDTDFFKIRNQITSNQLVIYTGPIDRYFNYSEGYLEWRTTQFEYETINVPDYQGAAVISYPDPDVAFTRIVEFKHFNTDQSCDLNKTIISREYSKSATGSDNPYYPVNSPTDKKIYEQYKKMAEIESNTIFGGRLGTYRYLDMHQAIASSLQTYSTTVRPKLKQLIKEER